ncbi:hypothetical protein ACW7G2_02005 [Luteimonas sp. A277]
MGSRWVISLGYGRCVEGYRRTQDQIKARRRQLMLAGVHPDDWADDLEMICLRVDSAAWTRLMAETAKFVEVGHG